MSNKVVKPVSFNVTKADDQKMLKHVKRRNFSGYVKKLIMEDIARKEAAKTQEGSKEVKEEVVEDPKQLDSKSRLEQLKKAANSTPPAPKLF